MAPFPDSPSVSIIIPVYNGGENFRRCLESLDGLMPVPEEVVVVSDGDTDGSWQLAEKFGRTVIRLPDSGGPARARNLGAQHARGDILLFLDADVTSPPDIVAQVADAFRSDAALDALMGSYDDTPLAANFLSQYKNLLHHYVHQVSKKDASTFWGACGAIRREVFIKMGGFDPAYRHPSIEDIELGYRLKKAGYKIFLLKHIQVKHLKRWGFISLLKADFFWRALPWTDLILNERRVPDDLNLTISSRVSAAAASVLLFSVIGSFAAPWLLPAAAFSVLLLLGLNWRLYRFFWKKRGIGFALKAIPWHWLYFIYSGLAFAAGLFKHKVKKLRAQKRKLHEQ